MIMPGTKGSLGMWISETCRQQHKWLVGSDQSINPLCTEQTVDSQESWFNNKIADWRDRENAVWLFITHKNSELDKTIYSKTDRYL